MRLLQIATLISLLLYIEANEAAKPTTTASVQPTTTPAAKPTTTASVQPTTTPATKPTTTASAKPTTTASAKPTTTASVQPTTTPAAKPTTTASVPPTTTLKPVNYDENGCPLTTSLDNTPSVIRMPPPNGSYRPRGVCQWSITVPHEKMLLRFQKFNIQKPCSRNYLSLSNQADRKQSMKLCRSKPPKPYKSSGSTLYFEYLTHETNSEFEVTIEKAEPVIRKEVKIEGVVYDDGEPEEWEEQLKFSDSEEYLDLEEDLCEAIEEALRTKSDVFESMHDCTLTAVEKIRVKNVADGEDDDDDDKDDQNDDDHNDDDDISKSKKRMNLRSVNSKRPAVGAEMDGVYARATIVFDQGMKPEANLAEDNIVSLISSAGAQNQISSFGKNVKNGYGNRLKCSTLIWLSMLLALAFGFPHY